MGRLQRHHLGAGRSGVDVAVHARLVALIAEIDLQGLEPLALDGGEFRLPHQRQRGVHSSLTPLTGE